jgi:hypothetical protein
MRRRLRIRCADGFDRNYGTVWQGLGGVYPYLESEELFHCPGRSEHGGGSPTSNSWDGDYCIGWYSGDDVRWGGHSGLIMVRDDGSRYGPDGSGWNWGGSQGGNTSPYCPYTFTPTVEQYKNDWKRGWWSSIRVRGANILFTDAKRRQNHPPRDVPHGGVAALARVDGGVVTLGSAFGADCDPPYDYNAKPHHEYGQDWWVWAERELR